MFGSVAHETVESAEMFCFSINFRGFYQTSMFDIALILETYNHSQNIWDKLYFSLEIAHYGKNSVSIFQKILASTDKNIVSGGGLNTRQKLF